MISLCPLTVLPCSPLDQIDAALDAGFDAIGLRVVPALATDIDVMADRSLRDAIAKRLSVTGIRVLDVEVVRISPRTDVAALEPLIQYADDLGARALAVTGDPKSEWGTEWTPGHQQTMERKLAELCELASRYRTRPALEFMIYRTIDTLSCALEMRETAGVENLDICIDALHFYRSGGKLAELSDLGGATLSCFQFCDAPAEPLTELPYEARFGRLLPGHGDIPLCDYLKALSPHIPIAVEVPDQSGADRSVRDRAFAAARATRAVLEMAGREWK